jgi:hypothetical protein
MSRWKTSISALEIYSAEYNLTDKKKDSNKMRFHFMLLPSGVLALASI